MAAHTEEALRNMSLVAKDVIAVLEGREPEHWVNREMVGARLRLDKLSRCARI